MDLNSSSAVENQLKNKLHRDRDKIWCLPAVTGEEHTQKINEIAKELGLNLICATHYATERVVLPVLCAMAEEAGVRSVIYPFAREAEYGI